MTKVYRVKTILVECTACGETGESASTIPHHRGCEYVYQQMRTNLRESVANILDTMTRDQPSNITNARQIVDLVIREYDKYILDEQERDLEEL